MAKLIYSVTMSLDGYIAGPGGDMSRMTPYLGPDPVRGRPGPGVTFVSDFAEAVRLAKEAAGDRDVNVLGADVARQCVAAGVLDEVLTFIAPVLLGDGTRLFTEPGVRTVGLERVHLSGVPLASILRFRVLPAG